MSNLNYGRTGMRHTTATNERVVGDGPRQRAKAPRNIIRRPIELPPMVNIRGDRPPDPFAEVAGP